MIHRISAKNFKNFFKWKKIQLEFSKSGIFWKKKFKIPIGRRHFLWNHERSEVPPASLARSVLKPCAETTSEARCKLLLHVNCGKRAREACSKNCRPTRSSSHIFLFRVLRKPLHPRAPKARVHRRRENYILLLRGNRQKSCRTAFFRYPVYTVFHARQNTTSWNTSQQAK